MEIGHLLDPPQSGITLKDSQKVLPSLVSIIPGMFYSRRNDRDWTMIFTSEGCLSLTGYQPDELTFNKVSSYGKIIHPDDQDMIWQIMQSMLEQKQPFELNYRITPRNGFEKWVREWGTGIFDPQGDLIALEGFIIDITDRKQAEMEVYRQSQRLQALRKIDMAITASFDLHLTLNILLEQITTDLNVDAADILLFNTSLNILEYSASRGFRTNALHYTRLQLGESFAGKAALSRQIIHIPDLTQSPGGLRQSNQIDMEDFVTYFGVPLIAKGQVKGVLEIFQRNQHDNDSNWLEFLEALAGQAAIAIDNATLFIDLQRSNVELILAYDATLEGWAKALELRDRETQGHTQRVIDITLKLAAMIKVEPDYIPQIRRGAMLHDIGKMGIPDAILFKPGPLTSEEWVIMRQHPIYAYDLLSPIVYLHAVVEIPYSHHEKWDGSGYPRSLHGDEIPLAARIFAVADVWDALTSDRPYRKAWSLNEAREYIHTQSGKHFDPLVVNAFAALYP